jgi:hypothetical protein
VTGGGWLLGVALVWYHVFLRPVTLVSAHQTAQSEAMRNCLHIVSQTVVCGTIVFIVNASDAAG